MQIPPQTPQSGKSTPTDSESVFTDDEEWTTNPNNSINGGNERVFETLFQSIMSNFLFIGRLMRPSESSVENDSIVFTYTQRFSKMPEFESASAKKVNQKRPITVAGLSLEKDDTEEQNKDVNSSDTENASPAIAYGPKDMNSVSIQNTQFFSEHFCSNLTVFLFIFLQ